MHANQAAGKRVWQERRHPLKDAFIIIWQVNEINFWLPLTDAFDSNSLHVESSGGTGDFSPVECGYGSV